MANGKLFFDSYVSRLGAVTVVEIGAQDVNGSLRDVCPANARYIGVDFAKGRGVDLVLTDPYCLPFDDESVDVVVSSSCFEHSEMFWLVFMEVLRILKPSGIFYLNAPSNGVFHRFPVDCWRFYPDSGKALVKWARRCGVNAELIESYTAPQQIDVWNDFVAVFVKDAVHIAEHPNRILSALSAFDNGFIYGSDDIIHAVEEPQDLRNSKDLQAKLDRAARITDEFAEAIRRAEMLAQELSRSKSEAGDANQQVTMLRERVREMKSSASWKITAPLRALTRMVD